MENKKIQIGEGTGTDDEINDSPIEQVRLTITITDDPTLPTLTFRTWILGPITCVVLSFVQQFYNFRKTPINLSISCFQLLLFVSGKFMAATLPSTPVRVPGTKWIFSMNPGPFNVKEHVLLCIMATSGLYLPYDTLITVVLRIFYHKNMNFWIGMLMILTSQMLGYGFAGIFMKFLVDNPYMWYPFTLVDVSFYRSLHEFERRPKGGMTKLQFFLAASVASFAYAVIPGYFFPSLGALSVVCWFWKSSVLAQLIGSGRNGFGIGSFALDWNSISGALSNPLAYPFSTVVNISIGFILLTYIVIPISYFTSSNNARHFPFSSVELFDKNGQIYNVSKVLNENDLTLNQKAYEGYSNLYLSTTYLFATGFDLASIPASLTHFIVFHGTGVWQQFKQAYKNVSYAGDVHNRLMKKYKPVPQWWFLAIAIRTIALTILSCEGFGKQLQLPYWGILLSCFLVIIFILPVGVLQATTGQASSEYSLSVEQFALIFIEQFKIAHYMKIAPKSMFVAQTTGLMISSIISFVTCWWLLSTVEHICDPKKLPKGSPWTCPYMNYTYAGSVIWGVMGPSRIFFPKGVYSKFFCFFLIVLIAPLLVWTFSKLFPKKEWIKKINVSNIVGGASVLPIYGAVSYWSWITVAFLYDFIVYRKYKDWWAKCNYVLAYGLDLGVALLALLTSLTLGLKDIYGVDWWGLDVGDHCPLAQCPTASGVSMDGCPTF